MHQFIIVVGVDYIDPTNEYLLNPGETRNCVNIIILNDNQFEFEEDLTGRLLRVTDTDRNLVPSDRVTVDIDETSITIEDNDGEFIAHNRWICLALVSLVILFMQVLFGHNIII